MIILGVLTALLTLLAAGFGATLLLMRGIPRLNLVECAALSWLFGSGVVSLLLWGGGLVLSGAPLQLGVGAAMLGLAAAGIACARRARVRFAFPKPRNALEWSLAGVIALEILVMFYGAFGHGLGWDGLLNWEVKARYAFLNDGVIPANYYGDETRAFTHQTYPLLIPLTELWFYICMGEPHQFWIKIIFPIWYGAGAILLAIAGKRLTNQRWPGLLSAALLFFVPCLNNTAGNATSGYVDVPLSVIYLAAVAYLILFAVSGEISALRISAMSLALLPWMKVEGSILWLIAVTCGMAVVWWSKRSLRAFLWLLPGAVILVAWKTYLHVMHASQSWEFVPLSAATVQANAGRFIPVGRMAIAEMLESHRWSFFWPIVAIAFVYLACRARDRRLLLLLVAVTAPITLYAATFVFSSWPDYKLHFAASFSRLVLHVMPVAWLAVAAAMPWRVRQSEATAVASM